MERFDVVVVGAGPAGSLAARAATEGGARTLLVDHRREIGQPVQCGEFLPTWGELGTLFDLPPGLERAYEIPPATVLRSIRALTCISPYGRRYTFPLAGSVVSRRAFDKALAARAEGAGAELRFPVGVTAVDGAIVRLAGGGRVEAKVIVGADGPTSTVARSVGLRPHRTMFRMITGSADGPLTDGIELYFGRDARPGYAWAFPRADDLNVGLGVPRLPPGTTLERLLDAFTERAALGPARERTTWWVPIGPPPETLVAGRVALAGDAANLVMATNGGGIPTAMLSGWLAGRAAARSVRVGVPLAEYDPAWRSILYEPLARAARIERWGEGAAIADPLLAVAMRYIGTAGLDALMRLRWPHQLRGAG